MEAFLKEFQHLKIQLQEIKSATNNFENNIIGRGGFGKVYEGVLSSSKGQSMVAFKRLDRDHGQGDPEFWKEILMLSRYTHENLILLQGFCDEEGEKILVYEHVSRGSLDRHLCSSALKWLQRLKICLGAARGLCYLHDPKETRERVLHRDIKSSNILLDENWNPKISDMGLSKIGPANQQHTFLVSNVVGTFGYVDPMYVEMSILTKESDVYSFGVVLFKVLCGRLCFRNNNNHFQSLVPMWRKSFKQKKLDEIIFEDLKQHIDTRSLEAFSDIAYQCLKKSLEDRPNMSQVVEKLEIALKFQEISEEVEQPMDYEDLSKIAGTPLVHRSKEEDKMLVSKGLFLNRGKTVEKNRYVKQVTGRHNDTELHLAARRGDLAAVKQILNDINSEMVGADFDAEVAEIRALVVDEVNKLGETALYIASEKGHLEVVKELLKYSDKETILKRSQMNFDPLHIAASRGHHAVVQLLLHHDESLCHRISPGNITPLYTAAAKGNTAVVRELLLNLKDLSLLGIPKSDGTTALHIAARYGQVEIVKALLEKDPQLAKRTNKKRQTALHMAVKGVSIEVVKLLLETDAALVMLPDKSGFTALHVVTRKERAKIVNELLSLPDVKVNALTTDHKTALDIAEERLWLDIREYLLRHGAVRANELNQPESEVRNMLTQIKERLSYDGSVQELGIVINRHRDAINGILSNKGQCSGNL